MPDAQRPMTAKEAFSESAPLPQAALDALRFIDQKDAEIEHLIKMGDAMANAIQERWTGAGDCNCDCCSAARVWKREIQSHG